MPDDAGEPTFGCLIRDLRIALGYSQSRLADRLCELGGETVTRETIHRWECGRRTPGPYWLRHLATALEVPYRALEDAKVRRRDFLTTLAATSIAPVAAADLIEHGFAAALDGRPTVEEWDHSITVYGRDYMSQGAVQIQQRLAGDMIVLQQQLEHPRMWQVASKLMTLYGKTLPGADGVKAIRWYRIAAISADRSGDLATRQWVRARAALALGYEGAAVGIADAFAGEALALDDRPSHGRLNAIIGRANVAAIRSDHETARRLITEAHRVYDGIGEQAPDSDFSTPEWRWYVHLSMLAARLGDERAALAAQDAGVKVLPPSLPRFRTHFEMHKGLMLARAGDRTGGAEYARNALSQLPPEKHSLTLRMLMAEIEGRPAA